MIKTIYEAARHYIPLEKRITRSDRADRKNEEMSERRSRTVIIRGCTIFHPTAHVPYKRYWPSSSVPKPCSVFVCIQNMPFFLQARFGLTSMS